MSVHEGSGRGTSRVPRPLAEQVVVITGGSRGIGRETAVRFARAGATVVVLGRDAPTLEETVRLATLQGGEARSIVCDVTDAGAMQAAADQVESWFDRIDTWVGNAGVLLYGRVLDTTPDEFRDMLEVNLIGQLHGIRVAVPALRRAGGGSLIVVTSVEAVVTLPMHGAYAASKHALEGVLDGLRRELRDEGERITVTAVRPAVIDTPIYRHARNRMPWRPSAPHPHYAPGIVAEAIAFAAEHPVRTIHAGGGGRLLVLAQTLAPGVLDAVLGRFGARWMHTRERALTPGVELRSSPGPDDGSGALPGRGRRFSVGTWLAVHPFARRVLTGAGAVAAAAIIRRRCAG